MSELFRRKNIFCSNQSLSRVSSYLLNSKRINKMKKNIITVLLLGALAPGLTGCASGLNSVQSSEYKTWESKGLLVKDKDPSTGAVLGILPGGGSFYAGEVGYGILNLLMWPWSILWDPVSGSNGAKSDNYFATKAVIEKKQTTEIRQLDDQLALKKISNEDYVKMKHDIEAKYSGVN